jgi:S-DNA-T family DNA segregation ATPase FtsK/SpoIIIE
VFNRVNQDPPRIVLPRHPEPAPPNAVPVFATLAPVAVSVAIWAVTGSPFALAFAVLGPVIALASLTDGKLHGRRRARRERRRFRRELAATRQLVDEYHERERADLVAVVDRLGGTGDALGDPERWRDDAASTPVVSIGLGLAHSALRLDDASRVPEPDEADAELDGLRRYAAELRNAPILVDPFLGIGVCGPGPIAEAAVREILVQVAGLLSPLEFSLALPPGDAWCWLRSLPHRVESDPAGHGAVRWASQSATVVVAVAATAGALPADCRVVLEVGSGSAARLVSCPGADPGRLTAAVFSSVPFALERAAVLSAVAEARGMRHAREAAPADLGFWALPPGTATDDRSSLDCCFAWSGSEPFAVDLVAHGPHAIVGGTTGSGKSELLVSWILAMAASRTPTAVNFLLVDFKGGASFAAIAGLAHVVGLVTDLDEAVARRAILSLAAEIRYRERFLASAGVRAIGELAVDRPLARLVIVVDEFAAMVVERPELHDLFADLAARGRSLGIHLILCTQRPAGVVRDSVFANAQLRISLRVNNAADSTAVIGSAAAAELPSGRPGNAMLSLDGRDARPIRIARVTGDDVRRVDAERPTGHVPPRRPWCDDLPAVVRGRALDPVENGFAIGLVDLPAEQRQETAVYDPAVHGNLLVVGGHRSGKSNALRVLAAAGPSRFLPTAVDEAWDQVAGEIARPSGQLGARGLLVIDDLDAIVARMTDDYQQAFVDMLVELLRSGPAAGLRLVIAVRRIPAALHPVAELCDSRLILRLPSRQDHLLGGGEPGGYEPGAPPGRGEWLGNRVQLLLDETGEDREPDGLPVRRIDWAGGARLAVVSTAPAAFERAMLASGCTARVVTLGGRSPAGTEHTALEVLDAAQRVVIIGDPEAWQSQWGLASTLRATVSLVFHACTPAEFRAVSGQRRLPPPIVRRQSDCWLLEPDGSLTRVRAFDDAPAR